MNSTVFRTPDKDYAGEGISHLVFTTNKIPAKLLFSCLVLYFFFLLARDLYKDSTVSFFIPGVVPNAE